jgi:hypothetical protein
VADLAASPEPTASFLEELFCAYACYYHVEHTYTCLSGVVLQRIPVPIGCEGFVVVGLTHIAADTMALRGYKSRKSTRLCPERVLSLQLSRWRLTSATLSSTASLLVSSLRGRGA